MNFRKKQGPQNVSKGRHNIEYLLNQEAEKERRKKMPQIFDAMGMPANNQPQLQVQGGTPVTGILMPTFERFVTMLIQIHGKDANRDTVTLAWEMANDVFEKIGFEYIRPMGCKAIAPKDPDDPQEDEDLPV